MTTKSLLFALILAGQTLFAANAMEINFADNGRAILSNDLIVVTADNKAGGWNSGLRSWLFLPTGHEMINVLYGQTDYVPGHMFGEVWDPATLALDLPGAHPDHGTLYVPEGVGADTGGQVKVLRQITQSHYSLQRKIVMRRDLAVLEVCYCLCNLDAPPSGISLRLHSSISPGARGPYQDKRETLFLPTTNGVISLDQTLNNEKYRLAYGGDDKFFNRYRDEEPSRSWVNPKNLKTPLLDGNWAALINREHGDGMIMIVEGDNLLGFYNCPGSSLEPTFRAFSLKPGDSYEVRVFAGSLTGLAGRQVEAVNPLMVFTKTLRAVDGRLRGDLIPLWRGCLRLTDQDGKTLYEAPVDPASPIAIDVPQPKTSWRIAALDREGAGIGSFQSNGKTELVMPEIIFPKISKPKIKSAVYQDASQSADIRAFIAGRDFTIYCPFAASEDEKNIARELSHRLGVGLSWTDPGGKMLLIGTPENNPLLRDAGLLKHSIDSTWPGAGHGALLHYANFEMTQKPLLIAGGSDAAGSVRAAKAMLADFLKDIDPPKGYEFWAAGTDLKVYPYTRPVGNRMNGPIRLRAAKGEDEPLQLVITAYENLENITVEATLPAHVQTGKPINRSFETVFRRHNGPLWLRWVNYWPASAAPSRKQGWTGQPDPLLERPETKLETGASQALWLNFMIPEGAVAGAYTSIVTCVANSVTSSLPIELEVRDFVLPKDGLGGEPYMSLANMPSEGKINPPQPTDRSLQRRHIEALISNFTAHGIRKIHLGPQGMFCWHFSPDGKFKNISLPWCIAADDGCILLDAGYFDWLIETIDEIATPYRMSYMLYAQAVLDGGGYGSFNELKKKLPERYSNRPKRDESGSNTYAVEEALTLLRRHLEQRGWLERMVLKIGDEPLSFDWWWDRALAARNAGMPLTTAFNSIDWAEAEKGIGVVRQWTPLYLAYNAEFAAKARAAGDAVSWYNCGPKPRITTAASASELRSYLWQAAKADLNFVVWWGIQNWNYYSHESLWMDRYSHANSVVYPEHPEKPRWLKPGRGWVDTAPLDSIRWELIREGMEDAWMVNLLRSRIKEAHQAGLAEAADHAQAELDAIWREVFPTLNDYDPPYSSILAAREKVAKAILDLQSALARNKTE